MDALGSGFAYLSGRQHNLSQLAHIRLLSGNTVSIGVSAGESVQGGNDNVFLGSYAGANAVSNTSVFTGCKTGSDASQVTNSVFQGYRAGERAEYITNSVYIGPYTGQQAIRSSDTVLIGYQAGANITSGSRNVILGSYAGFSQYNAFDNVLIGHRAGYSNKLGSNNVFLGTQSGFAATDALENVCLGVSSGENLVSGTKNVVCGYRAGANLTNASNCIAMGTRAMEFFYNGDTNTCLGTQVARHFTGNNNTILGGYSTANALGNYNTIVGSRSMNRQTLEQVNLSNCVILGENIQFDIPVRPVTANVDAFETLPDAYLNIETEDDRIVFQDTNESYAATTASLSLNIVPVGDPMLIRERYFSFGTSDQPCLLDTSEDGLYRIRWGSGIDNTNTLLDTVPVEVVLERASETLTVRTLVYGDETSWDIDATDESAVFVEQTFDPPSLVVTVNDETFEPTSSLPGDAIPLDAYGVRSVVGYTVSCREADLLDIVPGQEVQIIDSAIGALNSVFRVHSVGAAESGFVPITLYTSLNIGETNIGQNATLLLSRVLEVPDVEGVADTDGMMCTVPSFASFLVGALTSPKVYVHGDGDVQEGVYNVDVVDAFAGEFVVRGVTETLVGTVSLGTLEPLIVGLDIETSGPSKSIGNMQVVYNQRADTGLQTKTFLGPYVFDGHRHLGVGSQEEMDVAIRSNVITFVDGGYNAAEYTIGALNSTVSIGGVFSLQDDVNFGVEWLDSYTLSCITYDTWFECVLEYTLGGAQQTLANVSNDDVTVFGNFSASLEVRASMSDPFQAVEVDYPLSIGAGGFNDTVDVQIEHDIQRKTLDVRVIIATDLQRLQFQMSFVETRPPSRQARTIRYFADAPLELTEVRYTNVFFQDYPSFNDCIFIGSNFTVGGNAALEERSNVCIAAIGSERLFRGRFDEFEFFSDAVLVPTFVAGSTASNVSSTVTVHGINGNTALYVDGLSDLDGVQMRGDVSILGDLSTDGALRVGGDTSLEGTLTVDGAAQVLDLTVEDAANIGGDVEIAGQTTMAGDVDMRSDLRVIGDVSVESGLVVNQDITCTNLDTSGDVSIAKTCTIESTLDVNGATTLQLLDVTTNVAVGGRLDVDGVVSTDRDVFIDGSSVSTDLENLQTRATNIESDLDGLSFEVSAIQGNVGTLRSDVNNLTTEVNNEVDRLDGRITEVSNAKLSTSGGTIDGSLSINGSLSVGTVDASLETRVAVWENNTLKRYLGNFVTDSSLGDALDGYVKKSGGDYVSGTLSAQEFSGYTVRTTSPDGASGTNAVITSTGRIGREGSSIRYKENVKSMPKNLVDSVWQFEPCVFDYKASYSESDIQRGPHAGFIAEQVVASGFPEGVAFDSDGQPVGLRQTALLAATVGALQQLADRVAILEKKLAYS